MSNGKKLFGLGKGLGSLIPAGSGALSPTPSKENIFYIDVAKIRANPDQPRKDFERDALGELAKSIKKYGILQPLLVTKVEEENSRGMSVYYQLIAGERRLRASQLAGLNQVPVVIRDADLEKAKSERLELALIENIQRENLNPMEEAEAYARLANEFGMTQQDIATKVSKSREAVANTLRLIKLPKYIRDALRDGRITSSHARALLAFDTEARQKQIYDQIIKGGFSSKDVEASAANANVGKKKSTKKDHKFMELEKNLAERLKVPVLIKAGDNKSGQLVIRFATHEELNGIAKRLID